MRLVLLIVEKDYSRHEIAKLWTLPDAPHLPEHVTDEADRRHGHLVMIPDFRPPSSPCVTCDGAGSVAPATLQGVQGSLRPCPTCQNVAVSRAAP